MKKGLDVDGIEEILRVLITVGTKAVEVPDGVTVNLLEWFEQISRLDKFSLMVQFANSSLLETVREYLSVQQSDEAEKLLKTYGK
jgi:hypothetical protein